MAYATAPQLKNLQELLVCSVCFEDYTSPRTLRCGHIFCEDCLAKIARQHHQGHVICPECRLQTNIYRNVKKLPKVLLVTQIKDEVDQMPQSLLHIVGKPCEECLTSSATMRCCQCHKNTCDTCVGRHRQVKHRIVALTSSLFCSCHPTDTVTLFCGKCNVGLCEFCLQGSTHSGHDVTDIQVAKGVWSRRVEDVIKAEQDLTRFVEAEAEVKSILSKIATAEKDFNAKTDQVTKNLQKLQQRVNNERVAYGKSTNTVKEKLSLVTQKLAEQILSNKKFVDVAKNLLEAEVADQEFVLKGREIQALHQTRDKGKFTATEAIPSSQGNWAKVASACRQSLGQIYGKINMNDVATETENRRIESRNVSTNTDYTSDYTNDVSTDTADITPTTNDVSTDTADITPTTRDVITDTDDITPSTRDVTTDTDDIIPQTNHAAVNTNLSMESRIIQSCAYFASSSDVFWFVVSCVFASFYYMAHTSGWDLVKCMLLVGCMFTSAALPYYCPSVVTVSSDTGHTWNPTNEAGVLPLLDRFLWCSLLAVCDWDSGILTAALLYTLLLSYYIIAFSIKFVGDYRV